VFIIELMNRIIIGIKKRHPYIGAFSDSFLAEARSSNDD